MLRCSWKALCKFWWLACVSLLLLRLVEHNSIPNLHFAEEPIAQHLAAPPRRALAVKVSYTPVEQRQRPIPEGKQNKTVEAADGSTHSVPTSPVSAPSPAHQYSPVPLAPALVDRHDWQPTKQICSGYLLGIGTTKGGTTSLWGHITTGRFHPHLLAPASISKKELYWFMHNSPEAGTLSQLNLGLSKTLRLPASEEHKQQWQQLLQQQYGKGHLVCPAPGSGTLRDAPAATGFTWLAQRNYTAPSTSKQLLDMLQPLYRADITPEYMYDPRVPVRVKALIPEARMVVLLRDPVARLVSDWAMNWRQRECKLKTGLAPGAIEADVWTRMLHERTARGIQTYQHCYMQTLAQSHVLQAEFQQCLGLDNPYSIRYLQDVLPEVCASGIALVAHSVYIDQLERWFNEFPASQFKIWVSEDFQRDPISHMMQLPEWLGLDPALVSEEFKKRAQNNGGRMHVGRYDAHPLESTMQQLDAFFAPHNERLFKLLEAKGFGKEAARMREVWWPASSADKLYKKASTGGGRSAVV